MKASADVCDELTRICELGSPFEPLIGSSCAFTQLAEAAMNGTLGNGSRVRSIAWRILLGLLPPSLSASEWPDRLAVKRAEYETLKAEHMPDPTAMSEGDEDLATFNPLSLDAESPWQKFYEGKELIEEIEKDLARLYPTGCGEFFETPRLRKLMLNVLFVWSKMHPDTSYRQGMHGSWRPSSTPLKADDSSPAILMASVTTTSVF